MSAKDELVGLVAMFVDVSDREWLERVNHSIDNYAHELAEEIRRDAQARYDRSHHGGSVFKLIGGHDAADLIDPEVRDDVET